MNLENVLSERNQTQRVIYCMTLREMSTKGKKSTQRVDVLGGWGVTTKVSFFFR